MTHRSQWMKAQKNEDPVPKVSSAANLLALSNLVAMRKNGVLEGGDKHGAQLEGGFPPGRLSESVNETADASKSYDQLYHSHGLSGSLRKDEEKSGNTEQTLVSWWNHDAMLSSLNDILKTLLSLTKELNLMDFL